MTIRIHPANWYDTADQLRAMGYRIYCTVQAGQIIVEARHALDRK